MLAPGPYPADFKEVEAEAMAHALMIKSCQVTRHHQNLVIVLRSGAAG